MPSSRPAASFHALLRQRRWTASSSSSSSSSPPASGASAAEATPRVVPKSFASLQRAGNAVAAAAAAADATRRAAAAADGSTALAALDVSASSPSATGHIEKLSVLKGVNAFETDGASVLIEEIKEAAYPWNKLRRHGQRQDQVTTSVRSMLQALHGSEEGQRVFDEELKPRMRALRRSALYGLAGVGTDAAGDAERARHTAHAGEGGEEGAPSPAASGGEAEAEAEGGATAAAAALTTDDLLYLLSLPEHEARVAWRRAFSVGPESQPPPVDAVRRAAVRRVAGEHLREGGAEGGLKSVFVPMQEIPLSVLYAELKDTMVPDEYAGMAEQYMASIAESGEEGDVQPAFIPLPGGGGSSRSGGGDEAPPFLPIYLDPYVAEAYTRQLTEAAATAGGGRRYFVAEMKLAELFGELDNAEEEEAAAAGGLAPPSVVVGLNHNALSMVEQGLVREGGGGHRGSDAGEGCFAGRTGALWLTKADRALLKRHTDTPEERWSAEEAEEAFVVRAPVGGAEEVAAAAAAAEAGGGGEAGAGMEEEEEVEDAAMRAAQAELQDLLDDMIGLFKCVRRTVRFAYIALEEVAGEELFRIGVERRCAHNDPLAKRGEAMGGENGGRMEKKRKKKRRLRPIITPRGLLRLRMDFARKTAAQKPIPDLLTTEEKPKPYLKKYVLRWVTKYGRVRSRRMEMAYRRRPRVVAKDKDALWRERVYTHGELVKALKERPRVSELVRKSFVAFIDVDAVERERSAAHPFHASLPFFDCEEEYPGVARALPTEEEFRGHMLERNYAEDEKASLQHASRTKTTLMAIRGRESPYSDDELGETMPEEDYRLSEHDRAEVLLGPRSSRNSLSLSDRHFALARRQHQTLTEGYHKAVATHGPVGYTYKPVPFAEDLRRPESYVYRRTENADEGMLDHRAVHAPDDPDESLPRHMKERAVQKKAKELGVELLRHG